MASGARARTTDGGMFVWTVSPIALSSPSGSSRKPPRTTLSLSAMTTCCWRAARVKSLSPADFRIRA